MLTEEDQIALLSARIDQMKEIEMSIKKQGFFLSRHASSKRRKCRAYREDNPKQRNDHGCECDER
jgi:hypothetical protein